MDSLILNLEEIGHPKLHLWTHIDHKNLSTDPRGPWTTGYAPMQVIPSINDGFRWWLFLDTVYVSTSVKQLKTCANAYSKYQTSFVLQSSVIGGRPNWHFMIIFNLIGCWLILVKEQLSEDFIIASTFFVSSSSRPTYSRLINEILNISSNFALDKKRNETSNCYINDNNNNIS
jgi:hypothetical protein